MKNSRLLSVTLFSLIFAWAGTSAHAQWLPQPPTGSGPIYYTGGNVGIGTSVPSYFLHVVWNTNSTQSQLVLQNLNSGVNAGTDMECLNDTGDFMGMGVMSSTKSNYGALVAKSASLYAYTPAGLTIMTDYAGAPIKFAAGNSTEKMRIDGSGNVGIGTSTPQTLLHLYQSGTAVETLRLDNPLGGADLSNKMTFHQGGAENGYIDSHYDTTNGWAMRFGTRNAGTTAADRMIISSGGNVGINVVAPISRLQVNGNLSVGGGTVAGVPGTAQITSDGLSPVANRIAFGTDGTGWEFAISKNQGGAVTDLLTVHDGGNVGIGTTTPPGQKLVIAGNAQLSTGGSLYGNTTNQALTLNSGSSSKLSYDANNYISIGGNIITFGNNPGEAMRIYNGKVGIGVAPALPASSLQVAGDVRLGSNGTNTDVTIFTDTPATLNGTAYSEINTITPVTVPAAGQTTRTALHLKNATASGQGTNQIDLVVDGTITGASMIGAVYQDVAEWVSAGTALTPATVVVLDPSHDNQVIPSAAAYDTTVAGVVSARPGVILGVGAAGKEKIATTGRVKVKVDASRAPIAIGDLLVTSDVAGMAMKSQPIDVAGAKIHRPGTVIGKALQALSNGQGEILVLLSLQ